MLNHMTTSLLYNLEHQSYLAAKCEVDHIYLIAMPALLGACTPGLNFDGSIENSMKALHIQCGIKEARNELLCIFSQCFW
jgi:hypothetical protein